MDSSLWSKGVAQKVTSGIPHALNNAFFLHPSSGFSSHCMPISSSLPFSLYMSVTTRCQSVVGCTVHKLLFQMATSHRPPLLGGVLCKTSTFILLGKFSFMKHPTENLDYHHAEFPSVFWYLQCFLVSSVFTGIAISV